MNRLKKGSDLFLFLLKYFIAKFKTCVSAKLLTTQKFSFDLR